MPKPKRRLFLEALESRRVLTAPTFDSATLTVVDGSGGEGITFGGGSTFLESTDTVDPGANDALTLTVSGDGGIKSIDGTWSPAHAEATSAAGGTTFDLFLDSFFDVLVVDATLTVERGTVFNDTRPEHAASDHSPPIEALEEVWPDLHADLWLTTPGRSSAADSSSLVDGQRVSHFDTTDDGAQSGFHWGSVTLVPDETGQGLATLDVTIQTAATPAPLFDKVTVVMSVGGDLAPNGSVADGPSSLPILDGAATFDLTVSTPSDILVIDLGFSETVGENVPGGWFNEVPGGPNAELDSWVTTPGSTSFPLGGLGETGSDLVSIFDTTSDGPQDDFSFAQITLIPDSNGNAEAVFHGRLQTADSPSPTIVPFEYHLRVAQPSFDVVVSAPVGTTVGNVTATDLDGDEISYSIVGGNELDAFAVDSVTGNISTLKPLSGLSANHTLVLRATANGDSTTTEASINVLTLNNAPRFAATEEFVVHERAPAGTFIGAYTATDADGDELRYEITSGNSGEYFAYDEATARITLANSIDVDVDTTFSLELMVTDATGLSDTETVTITVIAAEPPPTIPSASAPTFETSTLTVIDRNSGGGAAFGGSVAFLESTNLDLDGSATFDLTVSTPTDILVLDVEIAETKGENVPGGWFNESVGGPDVALDSWVTTPGSSIFVNGDLGNLTDSGQLLSLFDTTPDGPQDNFSFAQITLIPDSDGTAEAVVRGTLQTADSPTPIFSWFEYQLRIGQTSFSLIENAPIDFTVGFVAATDPDGDEISYSIVDGNESGAFAVDPETGRISTLTSLTGLSSNHTLVLQATANGESVTTEVSITVFEQDRIPEFPAAEDFVVHESAPVGTVIGTFTATDDHDDTLRYDINSGNAGEYFAYDSATGQISVAKIIYVDVDTTYPLELVVTDARGLSDTATVNITVIGAEPPAELPQTFDDEATFTVTSKGNAATFDVLRSYSADEDSVANAPSLNGAVTFDLAISSDDDIQMIYGSMESPGLNVPGGFYAPYEPTYRNGSPPPPHLLLHSPELAYATWLRVPGRNIDLGSFATCHASQVFGLGASDADYNGAQDDFLFARVTLIPDENGNASAVFTGLAYTRKTGRTAEVASFEYHFKLARALFRVDPNAPVGATVGYVVAGDLDGDISYSIADGDDGDVFEINSETGEISTKKPLSRAQFSLVVEASANGQSSTTMVTINATGPEVPNSAPLFPPAGFVEVGEHTTIGSLIGSLPATDIDGDAMTYGLVARHAGAEVPVSNFSYDTQTGDIRLAKHFKVDDDTVFEIELTATDARGFSETVTMQVTVMNVNRRPSIGNGKFEIGDNANSGDFVGAVNAIDLDDDELDWAIVGGNDGGLFSVNESTGRISVFGALTADTTHTLILEATDPDGLSADSTVTVSVFGVDRTPVIDRGGVSGDGELYYWIPEVTEAGSPVATVAATDPFGNSLRYEIIESSAPGLFAYDSTTGELTLERAITSEDTAGVVTGDPNFRLMLQVTNSAGISTTTEVVVVQGTPIPADDMDDGGPSVTVGIDGIDYVATGWQNIDNPLDVAFDGVISPVDVLVIINELNNPSYSMTTNGLLATVADPPWYFDVNGDSHVSPIDVLLVINRLNQPVESEVAKTIAFAFDVDQADEDDDESKESPLSKRRVDLAFE